MPTGVYQHKTKDPRERFFDHVQKTKTCWLWLGLKSKDGYGKFYLFGLPKKREVRAHRFSYELFNGPIPKNNCVCHTCDTPLCVNPKHLWLGTNLDNIKDRTNKGRSARGEKNGNHKLTHKMVTKIRKMYAEGKYSYTKLGKIFSVSGMMISDIINNKFWKLIK